MKKMNVFNSLGFASFLSSVGAILVGLLVGFIILLISNPSEAWLGFSTILFGGISNLQRVGQTIYFAMPLIMTGLSLGFASKTGLFNIGASGQFIVGAFAAVYVGVKWTFLVGPLHWIVAILAGMLFGAIWGSIPGLLKSSRNVNVVISCIMMNYIGMYMVNALVRVTVHDTLSNQSQMVASSAVLPKMGLDSIFIYNMRASNVNIGIFIAILAAVIIYIILDKTKFGYELKASGYSFGASRYAGMNEKRNVVLTMAISGALAGLGGALLYLSGSGKGIELVDLLAPEGFMGIPVALLAQNNPLGIIFSGLFLAYLKVGGDQMQLYNFVPEVIDIITSVIIYFSAFALVLKGFIQNRKTILLKLKERKSKGGA